MLDVIHFFFEDDVNFSTGEEAEAQTNFRTSLYRDLYDMEYKYGYKGKSKSAGTYIDDSVIEEPLSSEAEELPKPFNPRQNKPKPFIKPTQIDPDSADPFNGALDSPFR